MNEQNIFQFFPKLFGVIMSTMYCQAPKPHNVVATTEEGRRLPFPVLQEIYEAYFWFFKR